MVDPMPAEVSIADSVKIAVTAFYSVTAIYLLQTRLDIARFRVTGKCSCRCSIAVKKLGQEAVDNLPG